jgi:hypothetical protein
MLPSHLPLTKLDMLVRDHCALTAEDCTEAKPLEMLIGYIEGGEYGGTPYENPESDETDPLTRLRCGERLVVQLHLGLIQDEAQFIDRESYSATEKEIERDEEGDLPDEACFPDETGFFGLGLRLDGDRLTLEPVRIGGDFNGNVCVEKAVFPASLAKRASAYLKGLA